MGRREDREGLVGDMKRERGRLTVSAKLSLPSLFLLQSLSHLVPLLCEVVTRWHRWWLWVTKEIEINQSDCVRSRIPPAIVTSLPSQAPPIPVTQVHIYNQFSLYTHSLHYFRTVHSSNKDSNDVSSLLQLRPQLRLLVPPR